MKISKNKLNKWQNAISKLDTPYLREEYKARKIARPDTVKDIDVRYAHDLLWAAVDYGYITYEELRPYNAAHIATALRNIVPILEGSTLGQPSLVLAKATEYLRGTL